ncbi:MAG: S-layer homology domain-containing protein [Lachnospirales bacterium]
MKRNLSSQAIRAMAIGMAVTLGSATAVSGVVTGTVVNVYADQKNGTEKPVLSGHKYIEVPLGSKAFAMFEITANDTTANGNTTSDGTVKLLEIKSTAQSTTGSNLDGSTKAKAYIGTIGGTGSDLVKVTYNSEGSHVAFKMTEVVDNAATAAVTVDGTEFSKLVKHLTTVATNSFKNVTFENGLDLSTATGLADLKTSLAGVTVQGELKLKADLELKDGEFAGSNIETLDLSAHTGTINGNAFSDKSGTKTTTYGTLKIKDFTSVANSFNNVEVTTLLEFIGTPKLTTASSFKPKAGGNTIVKLKLPASFNSGVDGLFDVNGSDKYTITTLDLADNTDSMIEGTFNKTKIGTLNHNGKTKMKGSIITTLNFADSVTQIEEGVFKDATISNDITIPEKITNIGNSAFENATVKSQGNITMNGVKNIGTKAFEIANPSTSDAINVSLKGYVKTDLNNIQKDAFGAKNDQSQKYTITLKTGTDDVDRKALEDKIKDSSTKQGNANVTVVIEQAGDQQAPTIEENSADYESSSKTITLTASENLAVLSQQQNTNQFKIEKASNTGTDTVTVTNYQVGDGQSVSKELKLTIKETLDDGEYRIKYETEDDKIKDEAGNKLLTKTPIATLVVANAQKNVKASLDQAKTKVTLTTTDVLSKAGTPVANEFKANSTPASKVEVDDASKTITLTFDSQLQGDEKLSYNPADKSNMVTVGGKALFLKDLELTSADVQPPIDEEKFDVTTSAGTYKFEKNLDGKTVTLKEFKAAGPIFRVVADSTFENGVLTTSQGSYYLTKIGDGKNALTELTNDALKGQTVYVSEVAAKAFEGNTKITDLSLPNVNKVGDSAFKGATALANLEVGTNESTIEIGNDVFTNTDALTTVKTNSEAKDSLDKKLQEQSAGDGSVKSEGINRKSIQTANGTYTFDDLVDGKENKPGTVTLVAFDPMDTQVLGVDKLENGIATISNKQYAVTKIGNGTDSMSIPEDFVDFSNNTIYVTEIADNAFKTTIPKILELPMVDKIGNNAFDGLINKAPFVVLTDKLNTTNISNEAFGSSVSGSEGSFVFGFGAKFDGFTFTNTNVKPIMNPYLTLESVWYEEGKPETIIAKYQYDFESIESTNNVALTKFANTTNEVKAVKYSTFENEMEKFAAENPIVINEKEKSGNITFTKGVIGVNGQNFILTQMGNGKSPVGSDMIDKEIGEHMVTVTDVKAHAFEGAGKLESLELPQVKTIGANAFNGCSGLTTLTLGTGHNEKITMDKTALTGCKGLTKVETNTESKDTVKEAVKESGSNAPVNGEKPSDGGSGGSGSGGSGSGGGSSSGGSGGGSGANIGTITNKESNTEGSTEETTSQGNNNNETVVENKQLSFDVIKLPSVEGEAKVFGDVSANHWAKSYIDKLSTAGIINGSNGMFNPNGQTKRADVTVMLVNLLGLTPEANNKFADVNASAYYAPYVGTASTYGIVNGSNGMFNPQGVISRQDTMVMIAQILKGLNLNVNADATALSQFGDASKVSAYANESVAILVNSGIISGNNGKLNPTAPVTRAEMATIMSKLYDVLASANK